MFASAADFMASPGGKGRFSGYEALKHLDPAQPLLVAGYGLNGPGELSLTAAVEAMIQRSVLTDAIHRGARPIATWTTVPKDRPAGSFSYSFHFASAEEQDFMRPWREHRIQGVVGT